MYRVDLHLEKGYSVEVFGRDIDPEEVKQTKQPSAGKWYYEFEADKHFNVILLGKKGAKIAMIHSVECNF